MVTEIPRHDLGRWGFNDRESIRSWQGYLWGLAENLRCEIEDDPQALNDLLTVSEDTSWLFPPVGDIELVEHFLRTLRGHGFTDEQTAQAYVAFFSCVLGLLAISVASHRPSPSTEPPSTGALSAYPTTQRLGESLRHNFDRETYQDAVESLIDQLDQP